MTEIKPSARGERAAMSGYVSQYDEFARRVYDHILQRDLEPFYADWVVLMLASYVVAIGYHKVLKMV